MWVLASWVCERRPGPLPLSVDVRRWLVGRDAGRTGQHLTAGVVASLGMLVVVSATVAIEAYPEHAQWYEVSVLSATTLAAGTQAYRNDGLLVSRVLAAMLFGALVFPNYGLSSPYPRYLDFVGDVAIFGGLLGTAGFVSGVVGRAIVARKRAAPIHTAGRNYLNRSPVYRHVRPDTWTGTDSDVHEITSGSIRSNSEQGGSGATGTRVRSGAESGARRRRSIRTPKACAGR